MTGFFNGGRFPKLFQRSQSNQDCCDSPNDQIMNCVDVMACVNGSFAASMTSPFVPYWNGAALVDSWFQRSVGGMQITTGKTFSTSTAGQTHIAFGVGGDNFDLTTDGGLNAESRFLLNPTSFSLSAANATNYVSGSSAGITLFSNMIISVASPLTVFQANALIQSFSNLTTIDFAAAGDNFAVTTDAGNFNESWINLTPTTAGFSSADGSLIISAGTTALGHTLNVDINTPFLNITSSTVRIAAMPTYANDAAAGVGGLVQGDLFQETGTGHVLIKQ